MALDSPVTGWFHGGRSVHLHKGLKARKKYEDVTKKKKEEKRRLYCIIKVV